MSSKFETFLSAIGKDAKKVFALVTTVAQAAEPIVDLAVPGIATLYNTTVGAVIQAEGLAAAAGQQSGSGTQKLAAVINSIGPLIISTLSADGVTMNQAQVQAWINAVVATLNAIPAPASA